MSGNTRVPRGGHYVRVALLAIAGLFVARIVIGAVLGGAIHPVTVLALVAGLAGGAAAITISSVIAVDAPPWERLWRTVIRDGPGTVDGDLDTVDDDIDTVDGVIDHGEGGQPDGARASGDSAALDDWRRTRLQLLFFAVAGGIYPWVLAPVLGVPGSTWAAVPTSLGTGALWAVGTFAVAAGTYLVTDTLTPSVADARDWLGTAAGHLAFGLVFGAVIGLWVPFFVV